MRANRNQLKWRFGVVAGLFLAIFSLYPQFKMLYLRGSEWNGHYAYNDIDEVAYGSYLKALIDGRPRKNDPYTGRDHTAASPQPESLFSIQFLGPYTIALPARLLGIDAPWAMTISGAITAFLTALAIFWLLGMITEDSAFSLAGSLVVLAGGALFAGEGAIGEILGTSYSYPYFPGFRRYVPAVSFPAFFLLVGLVWKLIAGDNYDPRPDRMRPVLMLGAALAFGYTVFTYFYVWTTAAAFLGCLSLCLIAVRPDGWLSDIKKLAVLSVGCVAFLLPYAYLLSQRMTTMDSMTLLVKTRQPDLWRTPELISFAVILIIAAAVVIGLLSLRERGTLFALSLALTVVAVFNQQIITGHSLQPIHYQVFIGNYVAGLAVVITLAVLWRSASRPSVAMKATAAVFAVIAAVWGFVECHYTVRILDDVNVIRDEALPVGRRLAEIDQGDPARHQKVVLHLGIAEADDLPTIAPQAVLWARHQHVFAGVTNEENKERFYQYLSYQGVDARQLGDAIKNGDFVSMIALFGWGRHTDRLNSEYTPLTFGEIDTEAARYGSYAETFDARADDAIKLDYLVASAEPEQDLSHIDKWYQRDADEVYGKYVLYRLTLR